jgi:hypothetical protein
MTYEALRDGLIYLFIVVAVVRVIVLLMDK